MNRLESPMGFCMAGYTEPDYIERLKVIEMMSLWLARIKTLCAMVRTNYFSRLHSVVKSCSSFTFLCSSLLLASKKRFVLISKIVSFSLSFSCFSKRFVLSKISTTKTSSIFIVFFSVIFVPFSSKFSKSFSVPFRIGSTALINFISVFNRPLLHIKQGVLLWV